MKHFRKLIPLLALSLGFTACSSTQMGHSTASPIAIATFVSDTGKQIRAEYRKDETVKLIFPGGKTELLPLAISGSGARYASDNAEWWEHQGEATYSINGKVVFSGKLQR